MLSQLSFVSILYKPFVNYLVFKFLDIDEEKVRKMEEVLVTYSISSTERYGEKLYKVIVTDNTEEVILSQLVSDLRKIGD